MSPLPLRHQFLGQSSPTSVPTSHQLADSHTSKTVPAARCRYTFTTKDQGNVSFNWGQRTEVLKNRTQALAQLGLTLDRCVTIKHGSRQTKPLIVQPDQAGAGMTKLADALNAEAIITDQPNLGLMILTADCLPIILYHPQRAVLAAAHLSRTMLDTNLLRDTIRLMCSHYQLQAAELQAVIGPGIHAPSYRLETPPVLSQPWWSDCLVPAGPHHVTLDLPKAARSVLTAYGIPLTQIWTHPSDTAQDDHYFSHYRSSRSKEPEGRFATLAVLSQPL